MSRKRLTEQERFERWYTSLPNPSPITKSESGSYNWYGPDTAWAAWKAAIKSMQTRTLEWQK